MEEPVNICFPFMKLPLEIRRIIWKLCLPFRIFEAEIAFAEKRVSYCEWVQTTKVNWNPPIIRQVCQESCAIAFEHVLLDEWEEAPHEDWGPRWLSPAFDIAFTFWEPTDTDIWGYDKVETENFCWCSERCQGGGVIADRLLGFYPKDGWNERYNPDLDVIKKSIKNLTVVITCHRT